MMNTGPASRTIRVFVSSTFSDFQAERDALQQLVFPQLREYCAGEGYSFQAIDLRWGVTERASENHETLDICLQELRRCQELSRKPNFIALLGNRYGWCPLPRSIPADEYKAIVEALSRQGEDVDLVSRWYRCDYNAVPPVYSLLPWGDTYDSKFKPNDSAWIGMEDDWFTVENQLRHLLQKGAMLTRIPRNRLQYYTHSATAHELQQGLHAVPNTHEHVFCYLREITNLDDMFAPDGTLMPRAKRYVDVDANGRLDRQAAQRLLEAKNNLNLPLSHIVQYTAEWTGCGITTAHVAKVCTDVKAMLTRVIDERIREDKDVPPLVQERMIHAAAHRQHLVSVTNRREEVQQVVQYLTTPHHGEKTAFLVGSQDSSDSSTVIAHVIEALRDAYPDMAIVHRYLGNSLVSSDRAQLFASLVSEIYEIYGMSAAQDSHDRSQQTALLDALSFATISHPLAIFLDGLENLANLDLFRDTPWFGQLPDNTFVVISITNEAENFAALVRIVANNHMLSISRIDRDEALGLLERYLAIQHRRLQPEQWAFIANTIPAFSTEVSLRMLCAQTENLPSFQVLEKPDSGDEEKNRQHVQPSPEEILLDTLEDHHGKPLVRHALGYLAAAQRGLSEEELFDLISYSPPIIADFLMRSPRSPVTQQLPFIAWARLSDDLQEHLCAVSHDGVLLLGFDNEHLHRAIQNRYLRKDEKTEIYRSLATYFSAQPLFRKGIEGLFNNSILGSNEMLVLEILISSRQQKGTSVSNLINVRRIVELPEALFQIRAYDELAAMLGERTFTIAYLLIESNDALFNLWARIEKSQPGTILRTCADTIQDPASFDQPWIATIAPALYGCGYYKESLQLYRYLESEYRKRNNQRELAINLMNQGGLLSNMKDYDASIELCLAAEQLAQHIGETHIAANAIMNRAIALELQGHYEQAERAYREAEHLYVTIGDMFGIAQINHNLSVFYSNIGRMPQFQAYQSRAIDSFEEARNPAPDRILLGRSSTTVQSPWNRARLMIENAMQHLREGNVQQAIDLLQKAELIGFGASDEITAFKTNYLRRAIALLDENVRAMIKQHDHRSAAVLLEYIETLHEKLGAHRERIKARSARGLLFCKMGDFESARTILEDSRDLAELLSFDDLCQQIEQELAKPPLSRRR